MIPPLNLPTHLYLYPKVLCLFVMRWIVCDSIWGQFLYWWTGFQLLLTTPGLFLFCHFSLLHHQFFLCWITSITICLILSSLHQQFHFSAPLYCKTPSRDCIYLETLLPLLQFFVKLTSIKLLLTMFLLKLLTNALPSNTITSQSQAHSLSIKRHLT